MRARDETHATLLSSSRALLECDYSITHATHEQAAILQALGLTSLIRHQELATRITPR